MIVFLFSFIGSQLFYQIFVVLFWFWLKILSPEKIAILRDWIWIIMSIILFLFHIKYWKNYFSKWWEMIVSFLILIGFTSFFSRFSFGKNMTEILIWIKYGFRYFFILLLSIGIWYFIQKRKKFGLNSDSDTQITCTRIFLPSMILRIRWFSFLSKSSYLLSNRV